MPSPWWTECLLYEVYVRSFADANGDGVGDLAGVAAHLDHLVDLGVDALWLTPFYRSPQADHGYDVSDHRAVDPLFGDLAAFDELVARAHARGLRVVVDVVPNHVSVEHPWFVEAVASPPGSPARRRFHVRPGRDDGAAPPNDWQSIFGGPAWTRLPDGEWYLHLFDPAQPDVNWAHPDVTAEYESIVRFWLDRGADGLRVDAAGALSKHPDYPDTIEGEPSPFSDRAETLEIYRGWRRVLDEYQPPRLLLAEAWGTPQVVSRYAAPGLMDATFTFEVLYTPFEASALRSLVDAYLRGASDGEHLPSWVVGSHDSTRAATRWPDGADAAMLLLALALPGGFCLYAGDELGLPEVDLPVEARQDPTVRRSGGQDLGRDGARVPLPWSGSGRTFGFSPDDAMTPPWLPQPGSWGSRSVQVQRADGGSRLNLVRAAISLRRSLWRGAGSLTWVPERSGRDDVLQLSRGEVHCALTTGERGWPLPPGSEVLLTSRPFGDGVLPPRSAVWFR
ncbi:alpha-amylase family glycosyl hydrolase [Angustibacter luteus]|uniref:Alpha-amylase family glycosyl hydrolase n=1 Tax=Angustibacter luteus TaxID=658456 RepID=A0ABW1JDJ2_9ACTN